jgi:lipopolysaccharide/colanic/teichoic acid biosynthesis glycosyltransferase
MHKSSANASVANAVFRRTEISIFSLGASKNASGLTAKRGFDVACAVLALVAFLPLILSVAVVVGFLDGWPLTIRHYRVGRGSALFPCRKFRTMVTNADEVLRRHLAGGVGGLNPQRRRLPQPQPNQAQNAFPGAKSR